MSYKISEACDGCGACVKLCPVEAISGTRKEIHTIDKHLCIECGVCGRVCPVNAIRDPFGITCLMVKKSKWGKPRFNKKNCISCNICIEACPVGCISLSEPVGLDDLHGYPYIENEGACIGCGFCARECPVEAVSMA